MALSDDVQSRVPPQLLIELTNPRDDTATSIGSTLLTQAATSVTYRFQMYAQETYSSTNNYHVELAVHGVVGLLRLWGSGSWGQSREFWEWFKTECEAYRDIGPRARITPTTNSPLTPSNEEWDSSDTIRPWSDDREFYDITPRRGGVVDDLPND